MNEQEKKQDLTGTVYEITEKGSLGLLALGARGLDMWRRKRDEIKNASASNPSSDEKK